jgi:hypothetical protein
MKIGEALPVSSILCAALVIWLGGCTTARIVGPLSSSDPDYPHVNPSPARFVQVHGTLSRTLDLSLTADYMATTRLGCTATSSFIAGAIEGATGPMKVRVPMPIARDRDKYTTQFAFDQFLPGRCGWHFFGVTAQVSKSGRSSGGNIVRVPETGTKETWNYNSKDTPVVWLCRFGPLAKLPPAASGFACVEGARDHMDKSVHILGPTSTSIEADVIDAESP